MQSPDRGRNLSILMQSPDHREPLSPCNSDKWGTGDAAVKYQRQLMTSQPSLSPAVLQFMPHLTGGRGGGQAVQTYLCLAAAQLYLPSQKNKNLLQTSAEFCLLLNMQETVLQGMNVCTRDSLTRNECLY